jgi:NAD(P)H-hydrate epimerase
VQTAVREAVYVPLPETDAGAASGGTERLDEVLGQAGAVAVGPGLTTEERTAAWVRELVRTSLVPVVLDADGLNAFAGRAGELAERRSELVLTPHAGEFARLANVEASEVGADRLGHARKLAAETQAVVLLKGSRTVIAAPDGRVRIVTTGGSFLATGGTGDVLTGAIAACVARGLPPFDSAAAAAYVHGLGGAAAAERRGTGTTAVDVLEHLAEAFAEVGRP